MSDVVRESPAAVVTHVLSSLTLSCGLFWKAFGIVCLLFLGWQAIKLAIWATKVLTYAMLFESAA